MFSLRKTVLSAFLMCSALVPLQQVHAANSFDSFTIGYGSAGDIKLNADGSIGAGSYQYDSSGSAEAYRWTPGSGFELLGFLPGDTYSYANDISANGSVIIGYSQLPGGGVNAVRWVGNNPIQSLGRLPGSDNSYAYVVSADGNVIAGIDQNFTTNFQQGVRWVGNNPIEALGVLAGGDYSEVKAINANGSVIAGNSYDGTGQMQGVRWVGNNPIEALGYLAGGTNSQVSGISADGSTIIGVATDATNHYQGVRWVGNNPIEGSGNTISDNEFATAISANGNVIIGLAFNSTFSQYQAFKWVGNNTPVGLGYLAGDVSSAVGVISADGSVIAGYSVDASNHLNAVIWAGNSPIQSVIEIATNKGTDLTGWNLQTVSSITSDGKIIAGSGTDNNGNLISYVSNIYTGGVTTPQVLSQSLQGNVAASQQANQGSLTSLGQSLFAAEHLSALSVSMAPSASIAPTPSSPVVNHSDGSQSFSINNDNNGYGLLTPYHSSLLSRLSVYTVGAVGVGQNNNLDNHDMNGTVGASVRFDHNISVGVGVLGASSHTNMVFNGKSDLDARGVSTVFSYLPQYGLRAFGTVYLADLDLTINRGYMNGNTLSGSRGTPNGNAHGAAAEIGYAMPINQKMTSIPFIDTRWSKTSIDAYSETGGPFDADFSTQKNTNVTSHLGYELDYQASQKTNLYGRASWGHRFSDNGAAFTATTSGLTQTLGLDPGDRNWAEAAIGTNYQATNKIRLSAELAGRSGTTQEPVTTVTVGANLSF